MHFISGARVLVNANGIGRGLLTRGRPQILSKDKSDRWGDCTVGPREDAPLRLHPGRRKLSQNPRLAANEKEISQRRMRWQTRLPTGNVSKRLN